RKLTRESRAPSRASASEPISCPRKLTREFARPFRRSREPALRNRFPARANSRVSLRGSGCARASRCQERIPTIVDNPVSQRRQWFASSLPVLPPQPGARAMTPPRSASVPFTVPPSSPLAVGWRAQLAALLERHGLAELLDVLAAYAELRCQHEPDDCSAAEEAAQGGGCRLAQPAVRRVESKAGVLAAAPRGLPQTPAPTRS